jgi:NAD(P)-dependent dehydrogenase (short-subunit alcohol dehydrogenase family)
MRLNDTVAVVTGAASGLGREITAAFVAEGAHVAAVDYAEDRLGKAVADVDGPGLVRAVVADVREHSDAERAIAEVTEAYVASKHGVEGLHRTLSLELEGTGVDSLVFTPPGGGVRTREAAFVEDPSSLSHEAAVVREPTVRLAAGEGRNGGRYRGTPDGEGFERTDLVG